MCPADRTDRQHVYPGVTLRDVRLAILTEKLWEKYRDVLKLTKKEQYEVHPGRWFLSVRDNAGYRSLGYFPPKSFSEDLWRNVPYEIIAYLISGMSRGCFEDAEFSDFSADKYSLR